MRLCSTLCTDISFILTRISERADIQGNDDVGFGTDGPHIKLNFSKMKYGTQAYRIKFEIENVFEK